MTMSICSRTESERSSEPSARISTSMPAKMLMSIHAVVYRANVLDVLDRPFIVEAVGEGQVLRVVGDGHVFVAAFAGGFGHFLDACCGRRFRRCACERRPAMSACVIRSGRVWFSAASISPRFSRNSGGM